MILRISIAYLEPLYSKVSFCQIKFEISKEMIYLGEKSEVT